MEFPVDVVITWVNQNDVEWQRKYKQHIFGKSSEEMIRFRDYGTLQVLIDGINKFAPWVRNIFLVTDNQSPLTKEYSNVIMVDHTDIMPQSVLPTFNSNVIDWHLKNIEGLSEHFIYFNDDMYLTDYVSKTDFFDEKGLPKDTLAFNAIMPTGDFDHIYVNNLSIINRHFSKKSVLLNQAFKVFNFKNSYWNIFSLLLLPFPRFTRFFDPHIPISYRKSTINYVVKMYPEVESFFKSKTRSNGDYSLWLVRYFEMLRGSFSVRYAGFGKRTTLAEYETISNKIKAGKYRLININDSDQLNVEEFEEAVTEIRLALKNNVMDGERG